MAAAVSELVTIAPVMLVVLMVVVSWQKVLHELESGVEKIGVRWQSKFAY